MLTMKFAIIVIVAYSHLPEQRPFLADSARALADHAVLTSERLLTESSEIPDSSVVSSPASSEVSVTETPQPSAEPSSVAAESSDDVVVPLADIAAAEVTPRSAPLPEIEVLAADEVQQEEAAVSTITTDDAPQLDVEPAAIAEEAVVEVAAEVAVVEEAVEVAVVEEAVEEAAVANAPQAATADLQEIQIAWSTLDERTKDAILMLVRADAILNPAE